MDKKNDNPGCLVLSLGIFFMVLGIAGFFSGSFGCLVFCVIGYVLIGNWYDS